MELAIPPRLRYPQRPEVSENPLESLLAPHVDEVVRRYLDPDRVEALAEDMRIVQRHRVHHAGLVAVAFVASAFEGGTDTEGRILDGWQTYQALGGTPSSETSFRRMAHKMVPVLNRLLRRRLRELSKAAHPELRGRLESFADVLVPDGCAFKLAAALSGAYPGTGQPAELKLHAVYSVRASALVSTQTTAGSVHDSTRAARLTQTCPQITRLSVRSKELHCRPRSPASLPGAARSLGRPARGVRDDGSSPPPPTSIFAVRFPAPRVHRFGVLRCGFTAGSSGGDAGLVGRRSARGGRPGRRSRHEARALVSVRVGEPGASTGDRERRRPAAGAWKNERPGLS